MITERKRIAHAAMLVLLVSCFCGCDYGRMKDQEAVQTYKTQLPEMPDKTVPVQGGMYVLSKMNPERLRNPLPLSQESINQGKENYGDYCVMCHGPQGDGNGTVGQSFFPLPTDLRSPQVQRQSDGRLFNTLTFGLNRHPPLGFMVTEPDRWSVVHYLRSLAKPEQAMSPPPRPSKRTKKR